MGLKPKTNKIRHKINTKYKLLATILQFFNDSVFLDFRDLYAFSGWLSQ